MGGSPDINYPAQPTYGEGMREALEAQVALLTGTEVGDADFSQFEGGLQKLVQDYEAPLRQTTAQIDTDVLRQTLLGSQQKVVRNEDGKYGIPGAEVVTGDDGKPQTAGGGRYVTVLLGGGREPVKVRDISDSFVYGKDDYLPGITAKYGIIDTDTGGIVEVGGEAYETEGIDTSSALKKINKGLEKLNPRLDFFRTIDTSNMKKVDSSLSPLQITSKSLGGELKKLQGSVDEGTVSTDFNFTNPNTGKPLKEGDVVRAEDGMIDLLGDKQLTADGRQPGFDAQGNFLGLSALAEDIQRGNLSRQREADLADVERLSGRFQDVMEDYRPGTAEAVTGAREVLESQKDRLTGSEGQIRKPTTDTFGGAVTPATLTAATLGEGPTLDAATSFDALDPITRQTLEADTTYDALTSVEGGRYTAAKAGDPMALTAKTSFDPSAGVTGEGFTATAGLEGGQISADPLRQALMAQAQEGLTQGLTDREERQIAEAARARSTMMGRTFDQSGAIAEAEARVLEDRSRQAQNRAFAQQILGQEAGLQESDLSRSLQAAMQNQAALNRAAEFGAGQDMQAQLANQAATNQALQAGMAAGLSQEALAAQQQQAREFANQQAQNRALEFGQTQATQAQLANQQAINQARQFAAQAGISQEEAEARLGQQAGLTEFGAEQQRRQSALQAGMQQDAQQAEIDQQRDILQAQLDQQGAAFGAEAAQQAALADQRQKQQANQFGVGATMDAERLNAQLAQQGALGYVDAATRLAALEDQSTLDPFSALLNRAGGGSLGQAGQVFGQANYGLSSGPQYLNPEAGLGFVSQMAANEASMFGAGLSADASRTAGLASGLGNLVGSGIGAFAAFCWVAREVYGPMNPQWMHFRDWMFAESPRWFFNLYRKFGERFANWISDKPRIKAIIRKWMDSKIGDK